MAASKFNLRAVHMKILYIPVVSLPNQERDIISMCSYTKYIPTWARFILVGY